MRWWQAVRGVGGSRGRRRIPVVPVLLAFFAAWVGAILGCASWLDGAALRSARVEAARAPAKVQLPLASRALPAPDPHVAVIWVGPDEIVVDHTPFLAHPAWAAEDNEVTIDAWQHPEGLTRIRLIDGEVAADARRGLMITALYERLLQIAEQHIHLGMLASEPELEFKGALVVGADERVSSGLLRSVVYTAGQAQFGDFGLLYVTPAGAWGALPVGLSSTFTWFVRLGTSGGVQLSPPSRSDMASTDWFGDPLPEAPDPPELARACSPERCAEVLAPLLRELRRYDPFIEAVSVAPPDAQPWGSAAAVFEAASAEIPHVTFAGGVDAPVPASAGELIELMRWAGTDEETLALLQENPGLTGRVRRRVTPSDKRSLIQMLIADHRETSPAALRRCYLERRLAVPDLQGTVTLAVTTRGDRAADEPPEVRVLGDEPGDPALLACAQAEARAVAGHVGMDVETRELQWIFEP